MSSFDLASERPAARSPHDPTWQPVGRGAQARRVPRIPLLHIVLFVTTFFTTAAAGAIQAGVDPFSRFDNLRAGFPFAITLMTILLAHELGHYFTARWHGVRASLPYFIPAPPIFLLPIGTFGAFIRMQSPPRTRQALFDVGAAGPWMGMILAIPAVIVGLRLSEIGPPSGAESGIFLGESPLFSALVWLALGQSSADVTITLHPMALAGWLGFFVTFLNLLPVGQLDGGHVLYALFGRWHWLLSRLFVGVIVFLGFLGWPGWFVWAILLSLIGLDHPPTLDVEKPLDRRRTIAAWLTVAVFLATFMPAPIREAAPPPQFEGEVTPVRTAPRFQPQPPAPGALGEGPEWIGPI